MLVGATAYRMLHGWPPHTVENGDVVLIWGGSGGLGSMAIQIAKALGGDPGRRRLERGQGRVLQEARREGRASTARTSTTGACCRTGRTTSAYGEVAHRARARSARRSGRSLGETPQPAHRLRAPRRGHDPDLDLHVRHRRHGRDLRRHHRLQRDVDLRYLWMRQKRLQGSHFANDEQANGINQLVIDGKIDPCLSRETFAFDETSASATSSCTRTSTRTATWRSSSARRRPGSALCVEPRAASHPHPRRAGRNRFGQRALHERLQCVDAEGLGDRIGRSGGFRASRRRGLADIRITGTFSRPRFSTNIR